MSDRYSELKCDVCQSDLVAGFDPNSSKNQGWFLFETTNETVVKVFVTCQPCNMRPEFAGCSSVEFKDFAGGNAVPYIHTMMELHKWTPETSRRLVTTFYAAGLLPGRLRHLGAMAEDE